MIFCIAKFIGIRRNVRILQSFYASMRDLGAVADAQSKLLDGLEEKRVSEERPPVSAE